MFDDYNEMFGGALASGKMEKSTMFFSGLMCLCVLIIIIAVATGVGSVMNVATENQKM